MRRMEDGRSEVIATSSRWRGVEVDVLADFSFGIEGDGEVKLLPRVGRVTWLEALQGHAMVAYGLAVRLIS